MSHVCWISHKWSTYSHEWCMYIVTKVLCERWPIGVGHSRTGCSLGGEAFGFESFLELCVVKCKPAIVFQQNLTFSRVKFCHQSRSITVNRFYSTAVKVVAVSAGIQNASLRFERDFKMWACFVKVDFA